MIIVAHCKAINLDPTEDVMVVRQTGIKTTKAGIKYIRENPGKFVKGEELEIIIPGKKFKVKETVLLEITWEGDRD